MQVSNTTRMTLRRAHTSTKAQQALRNHIEIYKIQISHTALNLPYLFQQDKYIILWEVNENVEKHPISQYLKK